MMALFIDTVKAREIFDSRGNPTVARMSMVRTKIVRFCRMRMVVT